MRVNYLLRSRNPLLVVIAVALYSILGAMSALSAASPDANLLINGSFESSSPTRPNSWVASATMPGWNGRAEIWHGAFGRRATDGQQKIELDRGYAVDSLSQSVQTEKGAAYQLSLDAYERTKGSSDIEIWLDNNKLKTVTPARDWQRIEVAFEGNGSPRRIALKEVASQNNGLGALIDNVRLTKVNDGVVPGGVKPGGGIVPGGETPGGKGTTESAHLGSLSLSGQWQNISDVGSDDVVLMGAVSSNDAAPGVVRLRSSGDARQARFAEWNYLDGQHGDEQAALLSLPAGRYSMADGTLVEVGRFELDNKAGKRSARWRWINFQQAFPAKPHLFLTAQSANGSDIAFARIKGVSNRNFIVSLYEEEAKDQSHINETIGYVAIYGANGQGQLEMGERKLGYQLKTLSLNHTPTDYLGNQFFMQEEQSKDQELKHINEQVSVLEIDGKLFAQAQTTKGGDTAVVRLAGTAEVELTFGTINHEAGEDRVSLTWAKPEGSVANKIAEYAVLRDAIAKGKTVETQFEDLGLANDTAYTYTIQALDAEGKVLGTSQPIEIKTKKTEKPGDTPAPSGLQGKVINAKTVELTWKAPTGGAVDGYMIRRDGKLAGTETGTRFSETGLAPGSSYSYSVSAFIGTNESSAISTNLTLPAEVDTTPPSKPGGLRVLRTGTTEVSLGWTASSDAVGVVGYRIERNGQQVADVQSAAYIDKGLKPKTQYTYTVKAYDKAGNVSVGSKVNATTLALPDNTAPSVPANLVAEADEKTVRLSWRASTDNVAVVGYRLLRNGAQVAQVTGTSHTDTGLSAATSYNYQVRAYDAAGNTSAPSQSIRVTTKSSSTGGGTGSIPQYVAGAHYSAGDRVINAGKIYECKPYPASGWCSQAAYEPGLAAPWPNAWTYIKDVEGGSGGYTNVTEYAVGVAYKSGDIVSNLGGIYRCKGWPYTPWCSQSAYEPGKDDGNAYWKDAWEYLGDDEVGVNSSNGQIAVTLPTRPDASVTAPKAEVNGQSFQLAWGTRTLLKTMMPGAYQVAITKTTKYIPRFITPAVSIDAIEVGLSAGKVTEVVVEYIEKETFASTTLQTVCARCHINGNALDTEVRAEKWLFNNDRSSLVKRIAQMGRGTLCTGECSQILADYLRDNVWEGFREAITNRIDGSNGQLPDNKGKRIIRLLTRSEYLNTLKDALGIELTKDDFSDYVPGRHLLFPTIHDRSVTDKLLSEYMDAAITVEKGINMQHFTQCGSGDTSCIVAAAGKNLFRRPLTASEITHYNSLAKNESLAMALAAMTVSPKFLYRTEMGAQVAGKGYQLTQYEIAAALSYTYTGRGPDELLFDLADRGDLSSPSVRKIQAERLLNSEHAKKYLPEFFEPLVEVSDAKLEMKDGIMSPDLIRDMKAEMELMLTDVVIKEKAGLDRLFNPGFSYLNTNLANHYGINAGSVGGTHSRVETNERQGGLLHLGIFHASNSSEVSTHLIRRARVVRENLLCKDLGTPVGVIPEQVIAPELASSRDFWTVVNGPDSGVCWNCHRYMNDIGFALDSFDIQGRYRTSEKVQGSGSRAGEEEVFDLVTQGLLTVGTEEIAFDDLRGLTQIMGKAPKVAECISSRYLQFARGYQVDSSDPAYLKHVYDKDGRIIDLMVNQVILPSFTNKQ